MLYDQPSGLVPSAWTTPPAEQASTRNANDKTDNGTLEQDTTLLPPRELSGWKWYITLAVILSSVFLYALDGTVVAVLQATIITDFNALGDLSWINVSFLMGATVAHLVWSQLYGQINNKWLYIGNIVVFEAGSALCGAAPSMNALIVGRVVCGVAGAGLYVGAFSLIASTTSIKERPIYISGTVLVWGLGTVLGPVLGGAFEQSPVAWRGAFYINLFIGAVCAPACIFLLPSKDPRLGVALKDRPKELDYVGILLTIGCVVSLIMAINFGRVKYSWSSGTIIGLFVTAGVLFVLLVCQQHFAFMTTLPRRLIPAHFMRSPTVSMLFVCISASAAGLFVPIFFVPLFFQVTRGDDALDAGVRLLPIIIVLIASIMVNGYVMARFEYYMSWLFGGGLLCVTGCALMYTADQNTNEGNVYGYTAFIGIGVCMWMQASFSVAQAVVDPANVQSTIGFITFAQLLGNTTTLAIANAIFLNQAEASVGSLLPESSVSEIKSVISGIPGDLIDQLAPDVKDKIVAAVVDAISQTYILTITAGTITMFLSIFMKRERLFIAKTAEAL